MTKIRLLLADDHAIVRRGLQLYLKTQPDFELVGEAATGTEVLERVAELAPDIVLMDLHMPVLNGIEATRRIRETHPAVNVIVLTSFSDHDHVLPAVKAGARGYLLKDIEPDELAKAIRRVHAGKVEVHPEVAGLLMESIADPGGTAPEKAATPFDSLTAREREVLRLIASGLTNKEIAEALHITEKTVKTHVSHVLGKLGLTDRTQAAILAVKHGLDSQP
ncbi:Two component transcriptional regulator, LuxR family [Thermobacillus xylanilyticus]|mgnify:FL=1|jgi:DNA-binding NarL/FixJ family response regulator|uniref:Response regulator containing a CheY-like receiver domain and an HTH DNA-binding domain n=2 Tax=Thermobacillus TaxID=76632 RepID=L0EGP6_THECK|nr:MULTISPECIES: response regulator transcription factor [Thermobacillus]AGA58967.1 response regulator containing a CheY-like receiver domain and an HTH DNA-binding domain [Thermobacillus composti KWC4]REJ20046.1 MAG: DNA-binding response regulator [Paenibacillaceae bacterium]CAG5081472.1 Two component transcriptional regulator, LuxR family [Thermobacillus xylanilyticus]